MAAIDGRKIAQEIIGELKGQPKPEKFLAAILVGEDPASASFVQQKAVVAKELGVDFRLYRFPADIKQDVLRKEVLKIAQHTTCGGVIVQLPLPEHIDPQYVMNVISREKDVDVLGERALGAFYAGRSPVQPPAVGVVEKILLTTSYQLLNARVAVIGRGALVGKPVATWLAGKARDLRVLHRGSDFSALRDADLVVTGAGEPGLIKPDMLKPGAGVIDFGYGEANGKLVGDLDTSHDLSHLAFYTPTPGGTGPILVAQLFENFYTLAA